MTRSPALHHGADPFTHLDRKTLEDLIASPADIVLLLDADRRVLAVRHDTPNPVVPEADTWPGQSMTSLISPASHEALDRMFTRAKATGRAPVVVLGHAAGDQRVPLRYRALWLAGQGQFLLLGRDARAHDRSSSQMRTLLALDSAQEAQHQAETRLDTLFQTLPEATMILEAETGQVLGLNDPATRLLRAPRAVLEGQHLADLVSPPLSIEALRSAQARDAGVPVTPRTGGAMLRLFPLPRQDNGREPMIVCRLCLDEPRTGPRTSARLLAMSEQAPVGMIATTDAATILSCNATFMRMMTPDDTMDLSGQSLLDHLHLNDAKTITALIEASATQGELRHGNATLRALDGREHPVDISVYPLEGHAPANVAFVLRPRPRAEAPITTAELNQRIRQTVAGRVGSLPLRAIVADTADLVERVSIEQALQMTQNNRVAAAEMLGLSRQSLYVKLRKYGLLDHDPEGDPPR